MGAEEKKAKVKSKKAKVRRQEARVDLRERLFRFSVDAIRFLTMLPNRKEFDVFRYQLSKSATSMGANYEESQASVSRREFESKVSVCLKEARESNYWLRIIREFGTANMEECNRLLQESEELSKIFATIIIKSKSQTHRP